jgi:phosphatidylglycerophosphatase A
MAFLPITGLNVLLAFILFRFFDTLKPSFVRNVENFGYNLPSKAQSKYFTRGAAVVLDDVLAGICANLILQFLTILHIL